MAAAISWNHYNDHNSFSICDRDIHLDSMTIGVTRGARGPRRPLNFQNIIPIWPPRLREIIKIAIITPSVFVIETYILTTNLAECVCVCAKCDPFLPLRFHFFFKLPEFFFRIAKFPYAAFGPLFAFHCPIFFTKNNTLNGVCMLNVTAAH